jgi:hypothetical protein
MTLHPSSPLGYLVFCCRHRDAAARARADAAEAGDVQARLAAAKAYAEAAAMVAWLLELHAPAGPRGRALEAS